MKAQVRSNSFLFSFLIVYGCSGCRPNTSRTLFTWGTFPWERFICSPSSSWAVWFSCGSSKPPGLPSSFLWWLIYAKLEIYPSQLFFTVIRDQRWSCLMPAGFSFGLYSEAAGFHLHEARAQLARWPHAREQEKETGRRWARGEHLWNTRIIWI